MTTNRLAKAAESDEPRQSIEERCIHANQQLLAKGINEDRRMEGLGPVIWVIRDRRVVCELRR